MHRDKENVRRHTGIHLGLQIWRTYRALCQISYHDDSWSKLLVGVMADSKGREQFQRPLRKVKIAFHTLFFSGCLSLLNSYKHVSLAPRLPYLS